MENPLKDCLSIQVSEVDVNSPYFDLPNYMNKKIKETCFKKAILGTTMKIRKELMIGDMVHSTRYNVDAKIIDVNHDSVWLELNGQWLRHLEEDVEPIKLTREIMTKNFPYKEHGYTIGWMQNDDGIFVVWESDNEGNNVMLKNIQYVHEIQHMLRLVKCKKEIELI